MNGCSRLKSRTFFKDEDDRMASNFRCIFQQRPGADKDPCIENFSYEECELPAPPKAGEITLQTLYMSLDPALRCRMNEATGVDYMGPWSVGETVTGLSGVGLVTRSNCPGYSEGDIVQSHINWPWIKTFNIKTDDQALNLMKVDPMLKDNPQIVMSLQGISGLTAYFGVSERGHVTPGANQTFVVSGAAGSCGNLAGQIARLLGATNIVGICGSDSKCSYLVSELGFTSAINYKTEDIGEKLRKTCPDGIHAYFDNVGGQLSETVIEQMVPNSNVILCGQIAVYNKDVPYPPPVSEHMQAILKDRNISRERYLVLNYQDKFPEGLKQLQKWYMAGKLKVPEFIHEGLEKCPEAFVNMMTSRKQDTVGKQMVRV